MKIPTAATRALATTALALLASALAAPCLGHDGPHAERAAARGTASLNGISVKRQANVRVPDIPVVDANGRPQRLAASLDGGEAVLVNFVFTTCSTICSTQTAVLAEFQRRLLADGKRARFVTVTIDPDNDTPERLAAFARQFDIERDWSFFTGEFDDLVKVQKAFDVYRGSKASHPPVVMLRPARESAWVRVEGMPAPSDLIAVFDRQTLRR